MIYEVALTVTDVLTTAAGVHDALLVHTQTQLKHCCCHMAQEEDVDDDAEATLVVDWNRVAADVNYRETIVLAAEAQAIVDKERADEVCSVSWYTRLHIILAYGVPCTMNIALVAAICTA